MPVLPFPVEAVIFDMDGLLLDTEQLYRKAFIAAASDLGYEMPDAFYQTMIGAAEDECYAQITAHFGPRFPMPEYVRGCWEGLERLLTAGIPVKPGATELLDELARRRLPAAVATSTKRDTAKDHLRRAGLLHRFDAIVTREDAPRGKPYPDLFLKAAQMLGAAPQRCLVFEDSPHGIRGAHAAGTMPVMVPDLLAPTHELRGMCIAVVADLHQALALLRAR